MFADIDEDGEVVAEPALEIVADERTQGITLVLTLALEHVRPPEDAAVELGSTDGKQTQGPGGRIDEVAGDDDVVEEVPRIAISQRTVTGLEQGDIGIEHVAGLQILDFALGSQTDDDAVVGSVVVQVAHDNDLGSGIGLLDGIDDGPHLAGGGETLGVGSLLAPETRGPMADEEEKGLAVDGPPHGDEVARTEVWQLGHVERNGRAALQLEPVGPIIKTDVDATCVGRIEVDDAIIGRGQLGLRDDVLHDVAVLYLGDADDDGEITVRGSDVEQDALKVADFLVVLGRIPVFEPPGSELLVEDVGIADRIEKVFEVVEDDFVRLLRDACREQDDEQTGEKDFLHDG